MQLTQEELIERGLPAYMNELGDWQKTDMVNTVSNRIVKSKGVYTTEPNIKSNNGNFDTWLRGMLKNFTHSLGGFNNDGSRTLIRGNVELVFYFNPDGSVNHVNQKAPALLIQLMKVHPTAPPEVLALGCIRRYNFVQKGAFQLTSILPDINYDGVIATNNTKVDGVHYLEHPNIPVNHAWRLRFFNANDRMTGQTIMLTLLNDENGLKGIVGGAQNIAVLPEAAHSWNIAYTDESPYYEAATNTFWGNPDLNFMTLQLEQTMDHNFKAEGSISEIFSLK
jgi:hypothetical protein